MTTLVPLVHPSLRSLKILETHICVFSLFSPFVLREVGPPQRACEIFKRPEGLVPKGTKARVSRGRRHAGNHKKENQNE